MNESNRLNDFDSDSPRNLSESQNNEKMVNLNRNMLTEAIGKTTVSKTQDALLCGKKQSHSREDIRATVDKRTEISDSKSHQKEFSAKQQDQQKKTANDKQSTPSKADGLQASLVSFYFDPFQKEFDPYPESNLDFYRNEPRKN